MLRPLEEPSGKTMNNPASLIKLEPEIKRDRPLEYKGFQYLFCLAQNLPLEDYIFKRKYTLQKHVDRWHL
jgi:hypothetical protein